MDLTHLHSHDLPLSRPAAEVVRRLSGREGSEQRGAGGKEEVGEVSLQRPVVLRTTHLIYLAQSKNEYFIIGGNELEESDRDYHSPARTIYVHRANIEVQGEILIKNWQR